VGKFFVFVYYLISGIGAKIFTENGPEIGTVQRTTHQ